MKQVFYRQCLLRSGATQQRVWIPEVFAVTGNFVRIDEDETLLWTVIEVGESRKPGQQLLAHERDYLYHRGRTDV